MIHRPLVMLFTILTLFVGSAATCRQASRGVDPLAPVVFTAPPSLQDVAVAINGNTDRVRQLQTEAASVSTAGLPGLRARIDLERPRRIRIRGKLFGPEVDLGSNDDVFWFWAKSSPEPAVYFARHDEFANSAARQVLAIEPDWIIEALGLARLEPGDFHEGPFPFGNGRVQVRSTVRRNTGEVYRTMVVDTTYGWILEQQLTDSSGRLLAAAQASNHRHYPQHGVSLPHRVNVQLPTANISFQIEVGQYTINQIYGDPFELWSPPQVEGHQFINLASLQPNQRLAMFPGASGGQVGAQGYAQPRLGIRPQYRGYSN